MSHLGHQIFSDPSGHRWKYIKIFFIFIFLLFAFVYGSLFSSIFIDPHISYRQSFVNLLHQLSQSIVQTKDILKNPLGQKKTLRNTQVQEYRPKYIAFHVNWDDASFSSLKNNLNKLDMVIPEFLHLNKATGELTANDVTREKLAMDIIKQADTEIPVLPLINNFDPDRKNWNPSNLFKITSDSHLRQTVIRNLANYVRKNNYAGITIDFESLTARNESGYVQFIQELSQEFKKENKLVYLAIPIADRLFDYAQAAPYVDSVILMAYDEHGALLEDKGPIASQQWFNDSIHNFQTRLPQTPIIIALANYGYDWSENQVESYTTPNVINLMQFENQKLTFDSQSLNPSFTYTDKNNQIHTVWYLDGVTAYNQMRSSISTKPYGFALWRLGSEDPTVWDYFNKKIKNIKPLPKIQSIPLKIMSVLKEKARLSK